MAVIGLFYTGMRVNEFIAMREHWQEMDDDVLTIKVPYEEGDFKCKTKAGNRTIYVVDKRAIDMLQSWYSEHPDGIGRKDVSVWKHIKALAVKAGIKKTVTPHILRHSAASFLAWSGMSPQYIQHFLGHKSPEITLSVYIHAIDNNIPEEIGILKKKARGGLCV